jgi:hypothetical protein
MTEVTFKYIKENMDKLDTIILCPGNLDELNSCLSIRKANEKYELAKAEFTLNSIRYNLEQLGERTEYNPTKAYEACLLNAGYAGVVHYSENFLVKGNDILASYSGMPIRLKEKWWKKYLKR